MQRALFAFRWKVAAAVAAPVLASGEPSRAGAIQFSGSGTVVHSSGTLSIGLGSGSNVNAMGNVSTGSSAGSAAPSSSGVASNSPAATYSTSGPNVPLNLSGSSNDGGGSSGGGLVWGDPLSADIGTFGSVHTRLHYFSQSGGPTGTQQAVGINFSIRY